MTGSDGDSPKSGEEPGQDALSGPPQPGQSAQSTGSEPVAGPPPHPLDGQWHIATDGKVYGPYSGHDIEKFITEGRVTSLTNVARVGSEKWQRAGDDRTLGALFGTNLPAAKASRTVQAGEGSAVVQINNVYPDPALMMGSEMGPKSPGIALLLSLLIPGVGQMYNSQVAKGILMLIGWILLWFVWLGWVIWIWAMIDAYQEAKHLNYEFNRRLARHRNG